VDDEQASTESYAGLCAAWNLDLSAALETEPVVSAIRALIMTGRFDPITPAVKGEMALERLPNGVLEGPIAGHDPVSATGTCGLDIVHEFPNHLRADVDAGCIDEISMDFSPTWSHPNQRSALNRHDAGTDMFPRRGDSSFWLAGELVGG